MVKIERILCPTDLSTESDEALRYAVALARAYNAELLLLHCTEINSARPSNGNRQWRVDIVSSFEQALIRHLALADLCEIKWRALAIENVRDVGEAISNQAKTQCADIIVMRSRRRPHAAILVGSTAQKVSRTAPCPVLVTHPNEVEWVSFSTGEIDLRRVLIAHDFSADSELALKYGGSLAQEYQAELHVLHVLDNSGNQEPEFPGSASSSGDIYAPVASTLQRAIPEEAFLWCNVVNSVRSGKVHDKILTYAKEQAIDLICMGASGSDWGVSKLFGTSVDRVLRQAPCPVLVAHQIKRTASDSAKMVTWRAYDNTKILHRSGSAICDGSNFIHDGAKRD